MRKPTTHWEKVVTSAWLRRSIPPAWIPEKWDENRVRRGHYQAAPDYLPPLAQRVYRRWPHIINAALEDILEGADR